MQKVGNGSVPLLNAAKNNLETFFGSGAQTAANVNIRAATNELATVFKGSGATDDEIKALGSIDQNSSPQQVQQYIEAATQLLASRLQALTDTYTAGMGKAPTTPFLSPTSIANLQNLQKAGFDIEVPGIGSPSASPSAYNGITIPGISNAGSTYNGITLPN